LEKLHTLCGAALHGKVQRSSKLRDERVRFRTAGNWPAIWIGRSNNSDQKRTTAYPARSLFRVLEWSLLVCCGWLTVDNVCAVDYPRNTSGTN